MYFRCSRRLAVTNLSSKIAVRNSVSSRDFPAVYIAVHRWVLTTVSLAYTLCFCASACPSMCVTVCVVCEFLEIPCTHFFLQLLTYCFSKKFENRQIKFYEFLTFYMILKILRYLKTYKYKMSWPATTWVVTHITNPYLCLPF